ncbi:MAG: hypothetical protein LBR68_07600 [Lachnoclostridium sp.]|jgi:uncharacterized FAD-dependent dehydrogenase|nr:hypothetical protein [Lachnoclostridium sp.]
MRNYKIIFIGAGISNLVAANALTDNGHRDFLILEKGKKISERKCPIANVKGCHFCSDACDVIEGIGGANALNGNKLCHFPASNSVRSNTQSATVYKADQYIKSVIPNGGFTNLSKAPQQPNQKFYQSDILTKNDFLGLINRLTTKICDKIIDRCDVIKIVKKGNNFEILANDGQTYIAKKVVLGTGRSSHRFLLDFLNSNNLKYQSLSQDVGIRIEGGPDIFTSKYYYQNDPKFKFSYGGLGSGRTFCAHNLGKVVPVRYGDSFFADGAFGNISSGRNNIALMVRSQNPISTVVLENWCKTINNSAKCGLVLGEITLKHTRQVIDDIIRIIPLFPSSAHKELFYLFLNDIIDGEHRILDVSANKPSKLLRIYGPAIDRYWIKPYIESDFSLSGCDGIYVVGDAAGLSRGFIQAMFSGFAWADSYLKKDVGDNKDLYDKIWSGGLSFGVYPNTL